MSSASKIFCANFDISTCSVLELNLIKRLDDIVFNDSPSTDTPMVLASPTVFTEELQICWLFSESILRRAIEGHPFLPRSFAFLCDRCGFTFFNVETVEDCILEPVRRFYSNAGIAEWSEHSQDIVKLLFTKLRRQIGRSTLAMKLNKPLGSAASFDVDLEDKNFCTEPVDAVVPTEEEVRATTPVDDLEQRQWTTLNHMKLKQMRIPSSVTSTHGSSPRRSPRLLLFSATTLFRRPSRIQFTCLRLGIFLNRPASSNLTS
jgi:hypothetical protein